MAGTGPAQAGLRGTGKPAICYVLIGWLLEDWKRAHGEDPGLSDFAEVIGITRSQAQNLRDRVRGFLAPGGVWGPMAHKMRRGVSGTHVKKRTNPKASAVVASGDFMLSFWRSGGVEAIDWAATSVVDHNTRYIPIGRKRPPVHLRSTRGKAALAPPPDAFGDLEPSHQVVIAYGAMVQKWEGKARDGMVGASYRLTGKFHGRTEAIVRSKSNPAPYVRNRCLTEIGKEFVRRRVVPVLFDLMVVLEKDKRGQWHIHGAVGCPVDHKEIIKAGVDRALGRWRHEGPSRRGYDPVLLERGVTTRGIAYGANKPACFVADDVQVAITRKLVREAKDFYGRAVADVLEYRRTGGNRANLHTHVLAPAGTYETDLMRQRRPVIWNGLESVARSQGKTLSRRMEMTVAALCGNMRAAIAAERLTENGTP